jgi:hypothetical protein
LTYKVIEATIKSFEAMVIKGDAYNKSVMSSIRISGPNVDLNSDSLENIDHIKELLNMLNP